MADQKYDAAGVDTGIAGFRADLVLIDDPVRSRADADSGTLRDRHWDWYKSDVYPAVAAWIGDYPHHDALARGRPRRSAAR